MPVDLISEDELRAALGPHRPDAEAFEAKVRERLAEMEQAEDEDPLAGLPPLVRAAAALLPVQAFTAGKLSAVALKAVPVSGAYKLLGYVVLPAASLLVLFGAAMMGAMRIRSTTASSDPAATSEKAMRQAILDWWNEHRSGFWLVMAATIVLGWIGATWILFCFYIASMLVLLRLLSAFAKVGLGNRWMVGQSCLMSMMLLGQAAGFAGTGFHDIHFLDQAVIGAVFLCGALGLAIILTASGAPLPSSNVPRWIQAVAMAVIAIPLSLWFLNPIVWPATDGQIKSYVESFDTPMQGRFYWQRWQDVASWTIERGFDPDLSGARRVLADELEEKPQGRPDQKVLSYALSLDLVDRAELDRPQWAELYERQRKDLFSHREIEKIIEQHAAEKAKNGEQIEQDRARREAERKEREASRQKRDAELAVRDPERAARRAKRRADAERMIEATRPHPIGGAKAGPRVPAQLQPILSTEATYWVLKVAQLRGDLTDEDRDFLASRLCATLDESLASELNSLDGFVWTTRCLAVIGRPVDLARYRPQIHQLLLGRLCVPSGAFQQAGGFAQHSPRVLPEPPPRTTGERIGRWLRDWILPQNRLLASVEGTVAAVELIETYGVPEGIDLNWVRSYLKQTDNDFFNGEKWQKAVTRDRLDRLSGAKPPSWLEICYYERSLLAAIVLVGLCIYATLVSPKPNTPETAAEAG